MYCGRSLIARRHRLYDSSHVFETSRKVLERSLLENGACSTSCGLTVAFALKDSKSFEFAMDSS